MSVTLPDALALTKVEDRWPQICDEILSASDLTASTPEDFKRLDSLYQRCLMCVPGFQQKTIDFANLHRYVLAAVQTIEHRWPDINPKELRKDLEESLQLHASCDIIDQAVNIAVCLWLGIDCVGPKHSMPKGWPETDSISHFVLNRRFDDPTEVSVGDPIARFPPKFRAARLEEISGISIESTYYLDQHLRFNEDTRTLKVFMDAVWLNAMCERFRAIGDALGTEPEDASCSGAVSPAPGSSSSPATTSSGHLTSNEQSVCDLHATSLASERRISFKPGACGRRQAADDLLPLFEETLRTLDVLFPAWDPSTIDFVDELSGNSNITSSFKLMDLYPQQPQGLTKFKFWRARLTELIVEHQSPPHDWQHIWKDRRNPTAYWTFWIGLMIFLLTLVFDVIASVLAVMTYAQAKSSVLPVPPS